jgi:hypothetical protein
MSFDVKIYKEGLLVLVRDMYSCSLTGQPVYKNADNLSKKETEMIAAICGYDLSRDIMTITEVCGIRGIRFFRKEMHAYA